MKVTQLGPPKPLLSVAGILGQQVGPSEQILISNGSNSVAWGSNVATIWSNGSNQVLGPHVNFASGSNMLFAVASNTLTIHGQASGAGARPYLDTYSNPLDGTYGDDFDGSSLNARWTRRNIVSGDETYQASDGSHLLVQPTATSSLLYTQPIPAGDFDFVVSMTVWFAAGTGEMFGLYALNSAGTGIGTLWYSGDNVPYLAAITTYAYASFHFQLAPATHWDMHKIWYRLKFVDSTDTYSAYISMDGINWSKAKSFVDTTTMDRICIGRSLGTATDVLWYIDRFDRVS